MSLATVDKLQPGELPQIQLEALIDDCGFKIADLNQLTKEQELGIFSLRYRRYIKLPEKVDDIRALTRKILLAKTVPANKISGWFKKDNPALEMRKPIDLIKEGHYEEVLEASRKINSIPKAEL